MVVIVVLIEVVIDVVIDAVIEPGRIAIVLLHRYTPKIVFAITDDNWVAEHLFHEYFADNVGNKFRARWFTLYECRDRP